MGSTSIQVALKLLVYIVLLVAAVFAAYYGLVDRTLETVIIVGCLGHLGIQYLPSATQTPQAFSPEDKTTPAEK